MDCLVDAHALLWHRAGDRRLPRRVRAILGGDGDDLHVSDATFWELSIKHSLGRLELEGGVESLHEEWIGQGVAAALPVRWAHILRVGQLPQLHGDPFDRMLVAQALVENLVVLTGDPHIAGYPGVQVLWD